jgi:ParB/RepB/Spo0J family partition protein
MSARLSATARLTSCRLQFPEGDTDLFTPHQLFPYTGTLRPNPRSKRETKMKTKTKTKKTKTNDTSPQSVVPAAAFIATEEKVLTLLLAQCHVSEWNPRQPKPTDPDVISLAQSIALTGQTTPAIVRPHPSRAGEYEIAAGSRRRVACEVARVDTLAAVVRELDDAAFETLLLVENNQRVDIDPKAEVDALARLVARGVVTAEALSAHMGKPESWVRRRLKLLEVVPDLRKHWQKGDLQHYSVDMMSLLGALPASTQKELANPDNVWEIQHGLGRCASRAQLQGYLDERVLCRLDKAPFDLNDSRFFVKGCGPGCACDSSALVGLFSDDANEPARCLQPACFKQRLQLANKAKLDEVKKAHGDLPIVAKPDTAHSGNQEILMFGKMLHVHAPSSYDGEKLLANEAKGAKKVIVWNPDTSSLKVGWLTKTKRDAGGGRNGTSDVKSETEKMTEKKAQLRGKRIVALHELLLKALRDSKRADCKEDVIDLAVIFGLPWRETYGRTKVWEKFDARKTKGYVVHPTAAEMYKPSEGDIVCKSREEAIWAGVKKILADVMRPGGNLTDATKAENDLRRVAKLIGFDFDGELRKVETQILPPKSWGAMNPHTLEPIAERKQLQLAKEQREVDKHVSKIKARQAKSSSGKSAAAKSTKKAKKVGLTTAARKRLAEAMRARWAARRNDAKKGAAK